MGDRWQLQEAKNRLSELVRKARDEGPQVITVHGTDAAVVMSAEQYAKLARRKGTLVDFFRKSPLMGEELNLTRSRDRGRQVDL
jgi:prevent-host-death family protein